MLAIKLDGRGVSQPPWNPQPERDGVRRGGENGQRHVRRFGIIRLLPKDKALLRPVQLRRDKQIDKHPFVVAPVNAVIQFRILFNASTCATPEGLILGVESLPHAWRKRKIVLRVSDAGPDRADAMIEQRSLVVIKVSRPRIP